MKYKQHFYGSKAALYTELSESGVFFEIAQATEYKNNLPVFDWDNKKIAKLAISELCHLSDSLKSYRSDVHLYLSYAQKLNSQKSKYKNVQFIHKTLKGMTRVGWHVAEHKAGMSFIIDNFGSQFYYKLNEIDIARLDRWLDFLINQAFTFFAYDSYQDNKDLNIELPADLDPDPEPEKIKIIEPANIPTPEPTKEEKTAFYYDVIKLNSTNEVEKILNIGRWYKYKDSLTFLNIAAEHIRLIRYRLNAYDSFQTCQTKEELDSAYNGYHYLIKYTDKVKFAVNKDKDIQNMYDLRLKEIKGE